MQFAEILDNRIGQIIISLILGLGLSLLFHESCKNGQCIIYQAPPDLSNKIFKENNKCVVVHKKDTKCTDKAF